MWIEKHKIKDITQQVEKFEAELGTKLPVQYRRFILNYNGGELWKGSFDLHGVSSDIRYFFGFIKAVDFSSINNKYHKATQKEFLTDKSVLAIAESSGGDFVAIGINDLDGQVFFWDHEKGYQTTKVADSFKEFVDNVKSEIISKETLMHPDDKIRRMTAKNGESPSDFLIDIYWTQYNEALNAVQEEVIID